MYIVTKVLRGSEKETKTFKDSSKSISSGFLKGKEHERYNWRFEKVNQLIKQLHLKVEFKFVYLYPRLSFYIECNT